MKVDIDARQRLLAAIEDHGSQRAVAEKFQVSQQYINDLVHGRRPFSDAILEKLGLRRTVIARSA